MIDIDDLRPGSLYRYDDIDFITATVVWYDDENDDDRAVESPITGSVLMFIDMMFPLGPNPDSYIGYRFLYNERIIITYDRSFLYGLNKLE